jgi:predicted O-methyltransferase YrrM
MTASAKVTDPYVLGFADRERQRLLLQSDAYEPATEYALRKAGIGPGMNVLDVGTGAGGVALVAARLVGEEGNVTAVDRSLEMVEFARRRVAAGGYSANRVQVEQADVTRWTPPRPYDAVLGRLILMDLEDPVDVLRRLTRVVRPGGLVIMADFVVSAARQHSPGPRLTAALQRVSEAFHALGSPTEFGLELPRLYRAAGLPTPQMTVGGIAESVRGRVAYGLLASILKTLLPIMERAGTVEPGSVDVDRFEADLRAAGVVLDATEMPPMLITAWARVGGPNRAH